MHPTLFEINTRVWIKQFGSGKLIDVPESYWKSLVDKGVDYVWLMGIWKTVPSSVKKYCFEDYLVSEYRNALKDWKPEDVIGSPFAIDSYQINPLLGNMTELEQMRTLLNKLGLKLILDFIPNHFHADSSLIKDHPEIFLQADEALYKADPYTFYKPKRSGKIFAHGRDPFFPEWKDTVQINYFSDEAPVFMENVLLELTKFCDGVRCDMAMLCLNNVFQNTWGTVIPHMNYKAPEIEFWTRAINNVKNLTPDFLFIAEVYWDMEWRLQKLGFDYTYDKILLDRLKYASPRDIRGHLTADRDYQFRSVRFTENHDEQRSKSALGTRKAIAASVIFATVPGMRMFYDGQFEGKSIKLPVQLGRERTEAVVGYIADHYSKTLPILNEPVFKFGEWSLLNPFAADENCISHTNILVWIWRYNNDRRLIAVNYSPERSRCRVKFDTSGLPENLLLHDLINGITFKRSKEEIDSRGLYIQLGSYQSHIFKF